MCLIIITLSYESVFGVLRGSNIYSHTHTWNHTGSCYAADLGEKPKRTDQSGDIINSEFWGKSISLLPSFQSSVTSSHLNTIYHHHHHSLFQSHLVCSSYSGCWCWHKQTQLRIWIDKTSSRRCSGPTAQTRRWGSRRGSAPVQSSA